MPKHSLTTHPYQGMTPARAAQLERRGVEWHIAEHACAAARAGAEEAYGQVFLCLANIASLGERIPKHSPVDLEVLHELGKARPLLLRRVDEIATGRLTFSAGGAR